jgi:hypothetical protein
MRSEYLEILKELIAMNDRGGLERACFDDIPIQVYHHPLCPGSSSTTIKTILKKSWNHCGAAESKDSLVFGSAFHCFNNEPHLFRDQFMVCPFDKKRGADWEQTVAIAEKTGKIILMQRDFKTIEVMSKKLWLHPDASELLTGAQFELTFFSRDQATGVLKKCRVDALKNKIPSDLKTTWDASEESFRRDSKKFGYGISAAFYLEILSEYFGELLNNFYLIPCEKEEPHEINTFRVHPDSIIAANDEIRLGLATIAKLQNDPKAWRGYPLGDKKLFI